MAAATAIITMRMTEPVDTQALLRLASWMSPAFPVGAFSYSGGLEHAIGDGLIKDAAGLSDWLRLLVTNGSGWNDAVLLAEAYRASGEPAQLTSANELAEALAGSRERHRETMLQGEAFLAAARNWPHPVFDLLTGNVAYPIAVGAVAGAHRTGLEAALAAYLHGMVSNLVSVAIRCGVTGQTQGVAILAALEPVLAATAARASSSTLDDLGSATIIADISALRHETMHSRLFRS